MARSSTKVTVKVPQPDGEIVVTRRGTTHQFTVKDHRVEVQQGPALEALLVAVTGARLEDGPPTSSTTAGKD